MKEIEGAFGQSKIRGLFFARREREIDTLELFGRKQDLAFEQPVGNSPRQRHRVRFWRWDQVHDGREVWFGAVISFAKLLF